MISSSLSGFPVGIFYLPLSLADNCFLILTHEDAVAFSIRTEDGGEYTFYTLGGHGIIPLKKLELGCCVPYVLKKVIAIMLN